MINVISRSKLLGSGRCLRLVISIRRSVKVELVFRDAPICERETLEGVNTSFGRLFGHSDAVEQF